MATVNFNSKHLKKVKNPRCNKALTTSLAECRLHPLQASEVAASIPGWVNVENLNEGDPLPPYNGKLRVYNMRLCPFAQRLVLALIAKQVDFDLVNINLMDKPEWLWTKSGFGKVPALEIKEDECIYESLVTVEYVDEVFPQRPLLAKDPLRKAVDKIIIEAMTPVQALFYKAVRNPESATEDPAYYKALNFIQEQLKSRGTTFLGGDLPGYADYMIWPWFEKILALEGPTVLAIDSKKFALLLEYFEEMTKDPAVSQYLLPKEVHRKFFDAYKQSAKQPFNADTILQDL